MRKIIITILLIISTTNLFCKEYNGPYPDKPNRLLYMGLGFVTNEIFYQTWYRVTKNERKSVVLACASTTIISFGRTLIESKVKDHKFHGCRFASMSLGGFANSILHDELIDNGKDWKIYSPPQEVSMTVVFKVDWKNLKFSI